MRETRICPHCGLPILPRCTGRICGACDSARRKGRLDRRLEQVREKLARGLPVRYTPRAAKLPQAKPSSAPPPQGPGLVENARVLLLWEPRERGRIVRRERDGWMVWVEGYGLMKVLPKEMSVDRRWR